MKCYRVTYLIILFGLGWSFSFGQVQLEIKITKLRSNEGVISLELFNGKEQIVEKLVKSIGDEKCTITINDLKKGKYAIRYFHDENSNKELDKNWLGMPKEGYGFSNDAVGFFGPKSFEEWLFDLEYDKTIVFETKY